LFFEFRAVTGHFFTPTAPSNINEKRADIYCDAGGKAISNTHRCGVSKLARVLICLLSAIDSNFHMAFYFRSIWEI